LFESIRNSNGSSSTMAGNNKRYPGFGAVEESSSVSDREEMVALYEEVAQLTDSQEKAEWLCRKASARVEEFPVGAPDTDEAATEKWDRLFHLAFGLKQVSPDIYVKAGAGSSDSEMDDREMDDRVSGFARFLDSKDCRKALEVLLEAATTCNDFLLKYNEEDPEGDSEGHYPERKSQSVLGECSAPFYG